MDAGQATVTGGGPAAEPAPAAVLEIAAGAPVEAVWRNELGGVTFRIASAGLYVKWSPVGGGRAVDLVAEEVRLRWAARWTTVPTVVASGAALDGAWLVTAAVPGENAVTPQWRAEPERTVPALGRALRAFHDALPVEVCPFTWEPDVARPSGPPRPPVEHPVVCHGDACAPNTLLRQRSSDPDGPLEVTGMVDLGQLGVGDPWVDLAIATWSTRWNYGPGWEGALLEAYGIEPDPVRQAHYRWLWGGAPLDAAG